jgi:hypothetical protein
VAPDDPSPPTPPRSSPDNLFEEIARDFLAACRFDAEASAQALARVLEREHASAKARNDAVYAIVIDGYHGGRLDEYDRNDPTKEKSLSKLLAQECVQGLPGAGRVSEMVAAVRAARVVAGTVHAHERFPTRVLAKLWGKHRNDKAELRAAAKKVEGLSESKALEVLRQPDSSAGGVARPLPTISGECRRLRNWAKTLESAGARVPACSEDMDPHEIEQALRDVETTRAALEVTEQELRDLALRQTEGE